MLLSAERQNRGSLCTWAREGPRCCTAKVWCQQSCRRRMRTCANGQSWFPRNLGDPGANAPHDTDCIGGADPPMVCAQALLKLACWCQQRSQSASGGESCPTSRKTEFPPAPGGRGDVCGAGTALDDAGAVHASERSANTESRHRSATTNAYDRPGGVG
jgi:hypothetical protein